MWPSYIVVMTIQGQVFERTAVCTARVQSNNRFSISSTELEASTLEVGDEVRVMLFNVDGEENIRPIDRDVYETTIRKSKQVYIPTDTYDKLDLQKGDVIRYVIIPKKSFPGVTDGPIRDKAKKAVGIGDSETEESTEQIERETTSATFKDVKMQKTGQLTIPADVRDKLVLEQGDDVSVTVVWEGNDISTIKEIGTGNRITLTQDERDRLGIQPKDEPLVRVSVIE